MPEDSKPSAARNRSRPKPGRTATPSRPTSGRAGDPGADATRCVHAGEERHGTNASLTTDIAQTSVFVMPSLDELRRYAEGKPLRRAKRAPGTPEQSSAYMYTRYANPTTTVAEQKIAALEGAESCVVTASGMAAELATFMAVCESGDEIVAMLDLYGGTTKLLQTVLPRFGIRTRFVPFHELSNMEAYFSDHTRMLFLETPTNPSLRCADIGALAAIGHRHHAIVAVDNTFATPILQKPLELGADLAIHSATKYLGGHNDLTAGAVAGPRKWLDTIREMVKFTGGCLDPFGSYLLIRGLKTLQIRVDRSCANARAIAEALRRHPKVARVMYPGFETEVSEVADVSEVATRRATESNSPKPLKPPKPADNPSHAIAKRQMSAFGMMVSFDIKGGGPPPHHAKSGRAGDPGPPPHHAKSGRAGDPGAAAGKFIDALKVWYLATSLGGVESTVSYPLLSSHVGLTEKQLELLEVSAATVRLSVGIEDAADLVADLEQALDRA